MADKAKIQGYQDLAWAGNHTTDMINKYKSPKGSWVGKIYTQYNHS